MYTQVYESIMLPRMPTPRHKHNPQMQNIWMNYIPQPLWTTIFHKLLALPAASPPRSSLSPLQIYIIPKILKEPSPKSE